MPSESLTAIRLNPVAGLVADTVAPGISAPCSSAIFPMTVPVVGWADTRVVKDRTARIATVNLTARIHPPERLSMTKHNTSISAVYGTNRENTRVNGDSQGRMITANLSQKMARSGDALLTGC